MAGLDEGLAFKLYDPDRLTVMRELIVADDDITRRSALDRLLPMQRSDFAALFSIMGDSPVTIRLLENHFVEVVSGRSRVRLVGLPAEDFPTFPQADGSSDTSCSE